jgi:ATP-dependent Clp protease ATP-binding subunit ClpX
MIVSDIILIYKLKKEKGSLYPDDIKAFLDQYIIGQDNAKITLSVAVSNHYKRINHKSRDIEIQKSNVLILGPTGSGKTLLAKTVAKYLDVPFVVADATSLTEAGYVGSDVESMISMLLQKADGDIEKAQKGIIFIDEIDKISRKSESASITRDVSGEGVQQALLKLVEGTVCTAPQNSSRKHPGKDMIEVDTTDILFIAGGAFVGLDDIISRRMDGSSIGFGAPIKNKNESETMLKSITPDDLTKFGMIPEFVGRFPTIVSIETLDKQELMSILTKVKNNFIDQYMYLFYLDGLELRFEEEALDLIVEETLKMNTGARGLQGQMEKVLLPHLYNVKKYIEGDIKTVTITGELVKNPGFYLDK